MMKTNNHEQRAAVPKSLRGDGAMYTRPICQELSHSKELELSNFCKGIPKKLEALMKGVYLSENYGEWNISSTALSFECEFSAFERCIEVSNLVFCDRACQYGLVGMLMGTLITLCTHWSSGRHLSLVLRNPIPLVRKCLENMSWCVWSFLEGDLAISWDNMASAEERIPLSIRRTKCCLNRHELINRTESWEVHLPAMEFQCMTPASCISQQYISSLECLFYRLNSIRQIDLIYGIGFRTDALCLNMVYSKSTNTLELKLIEVRPCLQGFGIGTMVFWRLMASCVNLQISMLKVARAYPSSVGLMTKLGGFEKAGNYEKFDDYIITLEEMIKKTLKACGLDGRLEEHCKHPGYYVIDPFHLPSAEVLNDQEAVEAMLAAK